MRKNNKEIQEIIKYKKDDIVRFSPMDEPAKLYRVLGVDWSPIYEDAVVELEDIETGHRISMSTQVYCLEMYQEAEEKTFGWVKDKGQHGWQFRDITNTTGLQHTK